MIFVEIDNGYVRILNEQGQYNGVHLNGNDWVSAQVNGDTVFAIRKDGYKYLFDKNGNMIRNV